MKIAWISNGTLEAHHLAAAYVAVWLIQGGYAGWIGWQWVRLRAAQRALEQNTGNG